MSLTFEQAQAKAKSLDGLDNETKLRIYSTFKCTIGAPTSARPGWTDPVGRAKWDAYSERSKVLTDTETAKATYVTLIQELSGETPPVELPTSTPPSIPSMSPPPSSPRVGKISNLIATPPIHLRYEYLSSIEISSCFIISGISGVFSLLILFVYIRIANDSSEFNALDSLDAMSKVSIAVTSTISLLTLLSLTFLSLNYLQTRRHLNVLQNELNLTNVFTLLICSIWAILQLSLSTYIFIDFCPIFSALIQIFAGVTDAIGALIMYSLHYSIAMHITLLEEYRGRRWRRWLILSPAVIVVGVSLALRILDDVQYLSDDYNPYNTKQKRATACSEIRSNTFTCELRERDDFDWLDAYGVASLISLLIIIVYCIIAQKKLAQLPYYDNLELNVSLRLYIWQTFVIYAVYIIMTAINIKQSGIDHYNSPCSDRISTEISSPETLVLISCWIIIRSYLLTPIPKKWRSRGKYKMRQGELQRFVWGRRVGERGGALTWGKDKGEFWSKVMGVTSSPKSRSAVGGFIRRGMSVKLAKAASPDAWKNMILEGDLASFEEIDDNILLREVGYGPEPKVLGNQPVFDLEVCAACMWMSKIVYADGVSAVLVSNDARKEVDDIASWDVNDSESSSESDSMDDIEIVELGLAGQTAKQRSAVEAFEEGENKN
ncbi:hypothetical protein TL16_g03126 [Triparma laevis f. inornata]|uniref:ACB domain-containing protein n=1 Tax=Triparma laevis f. inornata TaxID=1714386 RepID=A0A9W6ZUI6_9STRA|nr:hypothetical protein TL16_g03126 [Triparma laevis f. inornata]